MDNIHTLNPTPQATTEDRMEALLNCLETIDKEAETAMLLLQRMEGQSLLQAYMGGVMEMCLTARMALTGKSMMELFTETEQSGVPDMEG